MDLQMGAATRFGNAGSMECQPILTPLNLHANDVDSVTYFFIFRKALVSWSSRNL